MNGWLWPAWIVKTMKVFLDWDLVHGIWDYSRDTGVNLLGAYSHFQRWGREKEVGICSVQCYGHNWSARHTKSFWHYRSVFSPCTGFVLGKPGTMSVEFLWITFTICFNWFENSNGTENFDYFLFIPFVEPIPELALNVSLTWGCLLTKIHRFCLVISPSKPTK